MNYLLWVFIKEPHKSFNANCKRDILSAGQASDNSHRCSVMSVTLWGSGDNSRRILEPRRESKINLCEVALPPGMKRRSEGG